MKVKQNSPDSRHSHIFIRLLLRETHDILVVHGPPALYGDCDGETGQNGEVKVKGDGYLLHEIWRVRPKMVTCGHIHGAFGVPVIRHDGVQDGQDGQDGVGDCGCGGLNMVFLGLYNGSFGAGW